jgi:hypothetical protein
LRVVPAVGIRDDGTKYPAHVGIQAVAPGQLERVLALERIRRVVALERVLRVVEQHADIGASLDIDQAQQRAGAEGE